MDLAFLNLGIFTDTSGERDFESLIIWMDSYIYWIVGILASHARRWTANFQPPTRALGPADFRLPTSHSLHL